MPDALDAYHERAKPWLQPIPGASPAGASARLDPVYEAVTGEVSKLDLPSGGEVNWKTVVGGAGDLLKAKTKDVVLAAYLAHALHVTRGLDGLATGVTLVTDLLEAYWETAFPELKRLRGRANAVQWLLEKTAATLPGASVAANDAPTVEALAAASRRLADVVRSRFADAAPAMGPLLEAVARLKADVEASSPPPPPSPSTSTSTATAAATSTATSTSAPTSTSDAPAMPAAPSGALGSADGAVDYLRGVGTALISAAHVLRSAATADPASYRILRTGLWLHLAAPPPAQGGKTSLPAPPADFRAQLGTIAQNQKWSALLEESESALSQNRFWLDLHRLSSQALAGLGHDRAREAIAIEVRALVGRMPQLASLAFSDGTPLADAQTRAWIEEELAPAAAQGGAAAGPAQGDALAPEDAARLAEARKRLAAGEAKDALAELQAFVASRPGGRARFRARLDLARACAGAGLVALAKATYEELDREAAEHRLDAWEPALAAECLKGLILAARALGKDPRAATPSLEERYQRLCRLDPAAAHEVWP